MKYEKDSKRTVADPRISSPGAQSRRGRILWVWDVLMPRITYNFVVRLGDKIDIVNTAC